MSLKNFHYYDFIEMLIHLYNPISYLELGVQAGSCFKRMERFVKNAQAVDILKKFEPDHGQFFIGTTDEFFLQNKDIWDFIFIDANHEIEFVRRDLKNSLEVLSLGGICILHDTDPESAFLLKDEFCSNAYKIVDEIDTDKYFTVTFPIINAGLTVLTLKTNRRCLKFTVKE